MVKNRIALLALACSLLGAAVAQGQTVTLRLETYAGPNHTMNARAWPVWIKRIEQASGGEIKVQVSYPPVDPRLLYDRAIDGIADIVWSSNNYSTGRFPLAELADLPGLGGNAEQRSVAYWRTQQQYLDKFNEYKKVKLLTVFTHGPGMMHTRKAIKTLVDLKGTKLRMAGSIQSEVTKLLGAVGVSAPVSKANEMLTQGVVDGVLFSIETISSFKLGDAVKYHYDFPGGLYGSGFFAVLNAAKFDSLTPKQKQALASVSGEPMAASFGRAWDIADAESVTELQKKGNVVVRVGAPLAGEVAKLLRPVEAGWIQRAKAEGLADAAAALSFYRAEVKKLGGK